MMRGTAVSGGQQRRATWNTFAGIPWQVGGGKRHLERFRGDSVPGGRQRRTPGTLSREYRARWTAKKDTWNAFAGIPCQVGSKRCYLTRFCGDSVPGGRQRRTPDTLLQGNRGRWAAGKEHLTRFCGKTVAGGQREGTPGTLLQDFRARWEAGKDTWNTFAGKPCQVGSRERHLARFCRETVAGGQRERNT